MNSEKVNPREYIKMGFRKVADLELCNPEKIDELKAKFNVKNFTSSKLKQYDENENIEKLTFDAEEICSKYISDEIMISLIYKNRIEARIVHFTDPERFLFLEIRTKDPDSANFKKWRKKFRSFEGVMNRMKKEDCFIEFNENSWSSVTLIE